MAGQTNRSGKRQRGEQAPRSLGWRVRAERVYGDLSPERSWTLSASMV